jgi:hypothetical protein
LASDEVTHVVGKFGDDFEVVARLTKIKAAEETPNFGAGTWTRERREATSVAR